MATLKISDLSVGDWIQDKNGIYAKVLGIENWSNGYSLNIELHGVNVGVTPLTSAHPIPITPEILEANGFVDNGVGQHYLKCGNGITARVGRNPLAHDDCWLVATDEQVDETISTTCVLFDAKHIHQLQHALRLARVDKEINL